MTQLSSIPGIGKSSLELLEAAGFLDVETLAKAGAEELAMELERANRILQIAKKAPARTSVEKWISSARDLTGADPVPVRTEMPVNYEQTPQVISMLATAPFAIPLPARILVERGLAVGDIPPAIFLNRYSGDLEVKADARIPLANSRAPGPALSGIGIAIGQGTGSSNAPSNPGGAGPFLKKSDAPMPRAEIDTSRIKTMDAVADRPPPPKQVMDDRVALIRTPLKETNRGRDPRSRSYIRGVLHSHPWTMYVGAFVTLVLTVMLPLGIVSAFLLLLSQEIPAHFSWVPKELLVFPLALPVIGVSYLIWGLGGSCRICGQRQFVPRACLKNSKAHHIRGLGHIIPVCIHILLFKWFRCTYCGTPVRLKK